MLNAECSMLNESSNHGDPASPIQHSALNIQHSLLTPRLDPPCERRLTLTRRSSCNQTFDGDVVVELRPVNPFAAADQSPFRPFVWCAMDKSRIPGKRHRYGASVT